MSSSKERLFTRKELMELLKVSHVALVKRLQNTPHKLIHVEGSSKKVKAHKISDLPDDYQAKLKEQGIEEKVKAPTKILNSNFTDIYLMATPKNQRKAVLKCRIT